MAEEIKHQPNWEKVENLFDKLDDAMTTIVNKDDMNFMEISIAMMMLNSKIDQQKFSVLMMMESQAKTEEETKDSNMYG